MSAEQWIGVLIILAGAYFLYCSIWKRDFFLYKLKVQRVSSVFGEAAAHRFYSVMGAIMLIAGILKALGVF